MQQPDIHGQVMSTLQNGTPKHDGYRDIAKRIARLQERIADQQRYVEWLEATLAGAKAASFINEDDIADMTDRLCYLENDVAQHRSELDFFKARLDQLQTDQKNLGTKATPKLR